jgi:hypothetical protein
MLTAQNCFDRVIYSCKSAIARKDFIIQHKGKEYNVSLFVKTNRATLFKRIKDRFRHKHSRKEIPIALDLALTEKCGTFFIYNAEGAEYVKSVVLKRGRST